jgi:hypothetical protein
MEHNCIICGRFQYMNIYTKMSFQLSIHFPFIDERSRTPRHQGRGAGRARPWTAQWVRRATCATEAGAHAAASHGGPQLAGAWRPTSCALVEDEGPIDRWERNSCSRKKNEPISFITNGRWVISSKLPTSTVGESRGRCSRICTRGKNSFWSKVVIGSHLFGWLLPFWEAKAG